jgi:hypothetical protein
VFRRPGGLVFFAVCVRCVRLLPVREGRGQGPALASVFVLCAGGIVAGEDATPSATGGRGRSAVLLALCGGEHWAGEDAAPGPGIRSCSLFIL